MTEQFNNSMMIQSWLKNTADMWEQSLKHLAGFQDQAAKGSFKLKSVPRPSEQREEQKYSGKSEDHWSEMISQLADNAFKGYLKLQRDLFEKSAGLDNFFDAARLENAADWFYSNTLQSFENDVRKILRMPALGLTRFYQEKINHALEKYEHFNKSLTQFMRLFSRPFETSLAEFRKMAGELGEGGQNPKEYYKRWIKRLEAEYMALYKSQPYLEAMSDALSAYEEFARARNVVVEDILKQMPIPTNTDMDDLYKEMYQLKKRMKELEKQFKPLRRAS